MLHDSNAAAATIRAAIDVRRKRSQRSAAAAPAVSGQKAAAKRPSAIAHGEMLIPMSLTHIWYAGKRTKAQRALRER
jgi:hypothetical protein